MSGKLIFERRGAGLIGRVYRATINNETTYAYSITGRKRRIGTLYSSRYSVGSIISALRKRMREEAPRAKFYVTKNETFLPIIDTE